MDSIIAALSGTAQAITIAKAIRDAEKAYDRATIRAEMAEVIEKLVDARLALAEARDALSEKDREVERLKAAFSERAELVVGERGYKYKKGPEGNPSGRTMCPKCEVVSGRIVEMKQDGGAMRAKCPVCDAQFYPVNSFA